MPASLGQITTWPGFSHIRLMGHVMHNESLIADPDYNSSLIANMHSGWRRGARLLVGAAADQVAIRSTQP